MRQVLLLTAARTHTASAQYQTTNAPLESTNVLPGSLALHK
jgi:hypothetical protein